MPIYGNRQDAIYGNRYFLYTGVASTCETRRVWICTSLSHVSEGLRDRHSGVRESHVMLSDVGESLHDRRWSSGINSRDFCKESRVSSALLPTTTLSLYLSCSLLVYVSRLCQLNTRWSSRDHRKISSELQFSEKRIESPLDTYEYRVLLIFYQVHWQVFWAIEKLGLDQILHSNFSTRAR